MFFCSSFSYCTLDIHHDSFYSRPHLPHVSLLLCLCYSYMLLTIQHTRPIYVEQVCVFCSSFSYCTLDIHLSIMTVSIRGHTHPHVICLCYSYRLLTIQHTRPIYVERVCVFLFFVLLLYSRYSPV